MAEPESRRADLRDAIRKEGFRIGFSAVGFAPPHLPDAGQRFERWLDAGHHGAMHWMARDPGRRSDARSIRSGDDVRAGNTGRTVIACGLNYYAGEPASAPPGGGVVSQYARGEDYHRVLDSKLRALAAFAEARAVEAELLPKRLPGARRRIPTLVDHGPLLEKDFAERAGLGWIGKHSNVIATRGSSWFFLGEVLFPVDLPADDPHPDHCGTCTRCMAACPTDAIVEPYVVDSRRCISYLTIELRGPIPIEFRKAIGTRIFGCDDCQDVCPWNRFARKAEEPRLAAWAEGLHTETLAHLLRLTPDEFRARTQRSALRRAGYAGFLRNVAVALGNVGGPGAFEALEEALDHPEPLVRGHAAWGLAQVDPRRARPRLARRIRGESDPYVRSELRTALAGLPEGAPSATGSRPASPRR
jgi:epoxyqueuosine reductase